MARPGLDLLDTPFSLMIREKRNLMIKYGLVFMLSYLYSHAILYTSLLRPTPTAIPEHMNEPRSVSAAWSSVGGKLDRLLFTLSLPTNRIVEETFPDDPYYLELVYVPFVSAWQWFLYGCLFGWWRYKKGLRSTANS